MHLLTWECFIIMTLNAVQVACSFTMKRNQLIFPKNQQKLEFDTLALPPRRGRGRGGDGPSRKPDDDGKCPPCFNCMLPIFECKQFSECNSYTGRCDCIEGFSGDDCSIPLCGSLSKGNNERPIRQPSNETRNGVETCECDAGWNGINCNICQEDEVCDAFMPDPSVKGTCYKDGIIINKSFQGCDVTNEKILEVLKGKLPQVTFSCDKKTNECNFQFWIDQIESFYCGLDNCSFEYDLQQNTTHYACQDAKCKCIPGTMLCGANGSIDIGEFLTETIKGPGDFNCDLVTKQCKFSEPSMNDLISDIFGDDCIRLKCESGECIHYSEIPGYNSPDDNKGMSWQGNLVLALTSISVLALVTFVCFYIAGSPMFRSTDDLNSKDTKKGSRILLPEDEDNDFLQTNNAATLTFENISYRVPQLPGDHGNNNSNNDNDDGKSILNNISGIVKPGQIFAIMGGSGAGKTTLLDILAMKRKTGIVTGTIKVNGQTISRKDYSKLTGFVDQNDYLHPMLTVYETVLNSALLRLPRSMSFEAKESRVYQVLEELRIFDIKDRIIGSDFERGISGGEKRRVSIACELVTSPLILFLDEPTSGLDANNASNVINSLVRLSQHYNRTLVLTIHQPRSNIFYQFDKLVLLSNSEMVYSGDVSKVNEFLRNSGYECPVNYNIADYLIDITYESKGNLRARERERQGRVSTELDLENVGGASVEEDHIEDRGLPRSLTQTEWEHYAIHRDEIRNLLQDTISRDRGDNTDDNEHTIGSLNTLILHNKFIEGVYFADLKSDIDDIMRAQGSTMNDTTGETRTGTSTLSVPNIEKGATFFQQLVILNSRTFKNIYRNPKLLLGNYMLTILLSLFLGTLYYQVTNDISGFQNRMGLFFFILTYFGFVTFTGLSSFHIERLIFIKERSNNYYSPLAYYISKILSDVLPLRIIPPILMAIIIYPMVGLNMRDHGFFKFIGILILFNLSISLEILTIGIIFEDLNNGIILSVLILLGSLLFSGLFINTKDITNVAFKYLKNLSVIYYAYESLLINEVKTLMLKEKKYGLNIEVPGATILSTFGFMVQNLVFDVKILVMFNMIFLVVGYLALKWIVIEQK
ncbi:putative ATP-dependent permease ADP1 NDAI_0G05020 [Naumovozyma dairenensis CBS 421]|uniref:ABC transporter domain-containing protein n=1 Tax=Naumovozyma dairenensis (strain ATCC 10597 / BCRC 20456 / CBS 421 / NBRC 0211 / NRRL Y-12639) TaxID=1071378 RepID=J7SBQ8_NAUDC|nr:hypothetical protein NDAI_0G05020 [Naumovozyma dairenensis CBS 421]CCK73485.1 hypothetical protein NDAI_0G05020 [Naumovozyma dairenensis CBS 421]